MKNIFSLKSKVAIVTGGYGHLGSAMVESLVAFGARVIVAGRSEDKFKSKFGNSNDSLCFEPLDIMNPNSIAELMSKVVKDYGRIDILVNNAHTLRGRSQTEMNDDDWSYTLEGVLAPIHKTIREVMPTMKSQKSGKIINISSMYGLISPDFSIYQGNDCEKYINPPHYGAAKAGVIQLTKYYAVHLGPYDIQVNCISPGPFPKESIQNENPEFLERLKNKNPLHKIGKPEDLAGTITLLSGKASNFITGQNIIIDGGWTIW